MKIQICFLANVILLSRLIFTYRDKAVTRNQTILVIGIQILGLLVYQISAAFWIMAFLLILVQILLYYFENKQAKINEARLLSLLIYGLLLSIFFSPRIELGFSPYTTGFIKPVGNFTSFYPLIKKMGWPNLNLILTGLLFVMNEANLFVRYLFHLFNVVPRKNETVNNQETAAIDVREYNAGRVIGTLERIFVYYLVLNAQYAAIGLILAAKSFTRFKELEKREYAEYVLIGTLSSTLVATLVAALIKYLVR